MGSLDEPVQSATVAVLTSPEAAPGVAPPARSRSFRKPALLIGGLVAFDLLLLAVVGLAANALLSRNYSPERAVQDYFAAQARADVAGMLRNATYQRGEGSYGIFFGEEMVGEMMRLPENSAIHNLTIGGIRDLDADTKSVTVSMIWNGKPRTMTLSVSKDPSRVHWLFYPSWNVRIPSTSIHLSLPNQAGSISVDGISPAGAANASEVQTIMGYHLVAMAGTGLLDSASQTVEAIDPTASAQFEAKLSDSAVASARDSIKAAFNNCDAVKYDDCVNHTYNAPNNPNYVYYLTFPGYAEIDYRSYVFSLVGDPTAGMKLTVEPQPGNVSATGSCAVTMTVNGSRRYNFSGTYTAALTWDGGFSSVVTGDCEAQKG